MLDVLMDHDALPNVESLSIDSLNRNTLIELGEITKAGHMDRFKRIEMKSLLIRDRTDINMWLNGILASEQRGSAVR
jgi:hypothetical protein